MSARHRTFRDAVEAHDADPPFTVEQAVQVYESHPSFAEDVMDAIHGCHLADFPLHMRHAFVKWFRATPRYFEVVDGLANDTRFLP